MIDKDTKLAHGQLIWWMGSPSPVVFKRVSPMHSNELLVEVCGKLHTFPRNELFLTREEMEAS